MSDKIEEVKAKEEVIVEKPIVKIEEIVTQGMETGGNLGALAKGLGTAQTAMSNGSKDKEGYGYNYMTIGNLTDIIRPQLGKNGIAVTQGHTLEKFGGKPAVSVETLLIHEEGGWIKTKLLIPITISKMLSVAQMIGVASTYGRRYALASTFMITAEEDNDASLKG